LTQGQLAKKPACARCVLKKFSKNGPKRFGDDASGGHLAIVALWQQRDENFRLRQQ
jgi:hypothetical protein